MGGDLCLRRACLEMVLIAVCVVSVDVFALWGAECVVSCFSLSALGVERSGAALWRNRTRWKLLRARYWLWAVGHCEGDELGRDDLEWAVWRRNVVSEA